MDGSSAPTSVPVPPTEPVLGRRAILGLGLATFSAGALSRPSGWLRAIGALGGQRLDTSLVGYAFGTRDQDVTVFDPIAMQPLSRATLGVTVRWLSNEQTFWDGRFIWTYDFPGNLVQAVAIDPLQPAVAARIPTGGSGPAHSLMLMNDLRTAWVNVAGGNCLAVLDTVKGSVVDQVDAGKFP